MSLDISLYYEQEPTEFEQAIILLNDNGFGQAADALANHIDPDKISSVFDANITHNLGSMAIAADCYGVLWRAEDNGITTASQLIQPLTSAIAAMRKEPAKFEAFNSPNGWGLYKNFLPWLESLLAACVQFPTAKVRISC